MRCSCCLRTHHGLLRHSVDVSGPQEHWPQQEVQVLQGLHLRPHPCRYVFKAGLRIRILKELGHPGYCFFLESFRTRIKLSSEYTNPNPTIIEMFLKDLLTKVIIKQEKKGLMVYVLGCIKIKTWIFFSKVGSGSEYWTCFISANFDIRNYVLGSSL